MKARSRASGTPSANVSAAWCQTAARPYAPVSERTAGPAWSGVVVQRGGLQPDKCGKLTKAHRLESACENEPEAGPWMATAVVRETQDVVL
jgi:hypothetical protein